MLMRWRVCLLAAVVTVFGAGLAQAEGKGKGGGLARALSKAGGKGSSSAGLSRASQNLSRTGSSLGRSGLSTPGAMKSMGLGKSAGGALAGGAAGVTTDAGQHQQQLLIEQRNRDHRLAQAQHLRELAEKNGDANLAANADRMAAFAQEHYEQRVAQLGRFGVTDPTLIPPTTPPPTVTPPTAPLPMPELPPAPPADAPPPPATP